jgi:hypothetical protein
MIERGIRISTIGVSMQQKVQVSAQYLEAIRMEAGGDQDDDIDLCCQSPKRTLRTDCGKVVLRSAVRLSSLAASVNVRPNPNGFSRFHLRNDLSLNVYFQSSHLDTLKSHVLDVAVSSQVSWHH